MFDGTGYFFFSGVTNFGDWARVIEGTHPHWLLRGLLVIVGVAAYYGAILVAGKGLVRDVGIPLDDRTRLRRLTLLPYFSAIAIIALAGLLNPIDIRLVWQSALPPTAGAHSGLLWFRYYLPKGTAPAHIAQGIARSYRWILTAAVLSLFFIIVLGHGVTLSR